MKAFSLPAVLVIISACSYAVNPHEAGTLIADNKIAACHGNHTDSQACGNAIWNQKVIGGVHAGQTLAEVRQIMKHDAERRELSGDTETWTYITAYDAEKVTKIVFTHGVVTGMQQADWK
jgi:hypothetical protein